MSSKILPIALLPVTVLLGTVLSAAAWGQSVPTLKSVSVELPAGDGQFAGDGADAINNDCTACHSPGMVLNQPNMPKAAWEGIVHKMINVYKAPVDEKDVAPIVAYLTKNKGAN